MAVYEINPFTKQMERVDAKVPSSVSDIVNDTELGLQDSMIPVDASAGTVVLTAPLSNQQSNGAQWFISKRDSSNHPVIFRCQGTDTINDETELRIEFQYSTAHIIADGQGGFMIV